LYETLSSGEMQMVPMVCLNVLRPTISALNKGAKILQKSSSHLKILCVEQYGMKLIPYWVSTDITR